jgi:two-component system, NarL family, response regulator NreC
MRSSARDRPSKAVRIVLADDHEVVRAGLRALLEREPGFSVVGETSDGLQVGEVVARTKPHVLVLDLVMPGLNGIDVAREVTKRSPGTRIVVFTMHSSESLVIRALRNGVAGYVLKGSSAAELVQAIREALAGRRYLSPPLSDRAIETYLARVREAHADPYDSLTTRERQVLHLAAEGLSSAAVGVRLGIGARTVDTHRTHLMKKLGLRSRRDLIVYALQRGLLRTEPRGTPR